MTPDHPDETDEYLAAMRRFLNHPLGTHIAGCFWDFGSIPQKPRSDADQKIFDEAINVMNSVYASAMGTMVVRHRTIPKRPRGSTASWWCSSRTEETVALSCQKSRWTPASDDLGFRMGPDGVGYLKPGSPGEKSGMRVGDVILSVNGQGPKTRRRQRSALLGGRRHD